MESNNSQKPSDNSEAFSEEKKTEITKAVNGSQPEPEKKTRQRRQRIAVWSVLAVALIGNAASDAYQGWRIRKLDQGQKEISQLLKRQSESDRSPSRDILQNAMGQIDAIMKVVEIQGEDLQKPEYYEESVKMQCRRVLPVARNYLSETNQNDPEAQALKRNIETLEELAGEWEQATKKTRSQRLYARLSQAKSVFEVLFSLSQLAKVGEPPLDVQPVRII